MSTTTMKEQKIQTLYRSIVALNGIGVTLLEQGCYSQAMICLKDAASILKMSVTQPTPGVPDIVANCNLDAATKMVADMLQNANQSLTQPRPQQQQQQQQINVVVTRKTLSGSPSSPSSTTTTTLLLKPVSLKTIGDPSSIIAMGACNSGHHNNAKAEAGQQQQEVAHPIRLEGLDSGSSTSTTSYNEYFKLETGVTLHNLAITYLCLASIATTPSKVRKVRGAALKLFGLAHQALHPLLESSLFCNDKGTTTTSIMPQFIFANVANLTNYVPLLVEFRMTSQAKILRSVFVNLLSLVARLLVVTQELKGKRSSASAA